MENSDLKRKSKEELKQIASGLGIQKISSLTKEKLIERILETKEKNICVDVSESDVLQNSARKKARPDGVYEVSGILEIFNDGFGFLRVEGLKPCENDVYVSPTQIRRFNLRNGDEIVGDARDAREEDKYSPLLYLKTINGDGIDSVFKRRLFDRLTPIYPTDKLKLDMGISEKLASRVIDIIAPIGKGQRGMIVAPPKAGKTTIIKQIAQSIETNHPEAKLFILLIDERPEEVTDIRRSVKGEVVASTFDQTPENHCKVSEMILDRAYRLVEHKKDVVILMDSITRLARAYNQTVTPTGRTLSGGIDPDALIKPKRFFGAARNIEEGGSLTIIATALVETGSRMDDVIFEEFKGTGNMELKLDRNLQEKRIFPAIDILKSGTRREEELLSEEELRVSQLIRNSVSKPSSGNDGYLKILEHLKSTPDNKGFITKMLNSK